MRGMHVMTVSAKPEVVLYHLEIWRRNMRWMSNSFIFAASVSWHHQIPIPYVMIFSVVLVYRIFNIVFLMPRDLVVNLVELC